MKNTTVQRAAFMEALTLSQRRFRTLFDARVRAQGLTLPRARTLISLHASDRLNQSELAEILGVEGPTLVRMLDGLEKLGLVTRHIAPLDRRVRELALTEAGRTAARSLQDLVEDMRAELLGDVSAADLDIAVRVLRSAADAASGVRATQALAGNDGGHE